MGFRLQTQCCSELLFQREAKCNRKGFALSLVSKVKVYGTWQNLPIVDKSLVATAQAGPEGGGGGGPPGDFGGVGEAWVELWWTVGFGGVRDGWRVGWIGGGCGTQSNLDDGPTC